MLLGEVTQRPSGPQVTRSPDTAGPHWCREEQMPRECPSLWVGVLLLQPHLLPSTPASLRSRKDLCLWIKLSFNGNLSRTPSKLFYSTVAASKKTSSPEYLPRSLRKVTEARNDNSKRRSTFFFIYCQDLNCARLKPSPPAIKVSASNEGLK